LIGKNWSPNPFLKLFKRLNQGRLITNFKAFGGLRLIRGNWKALFGKVNPWIKKFWAFHYWGEAWIIGRFGKGRGDFIITSSLNWINGGSY